MCPAEYSRKLWEKELKEEAKVVENPKRSFFMKGRKSSDTINTLLKEIHAIRGTEMSKLLTKKN